MRRILLALLLATGVAEARSEKTLAYPRDQAWPAAVRFIRVDAKLKITEKDADAGYVIFEFKEDHKTFRGSLEVIDIVKEGHKYVRFVMTIEDRPTWVEVDLLTKLERKLRVELGTPAPEPSPRDRPKDAPTPDEPPAPPKNDGPPISDKP